MIDQLIFFGSAIAAGALVATALSLYGVHLATRDSSLQCMVMSQGAQLGVLFTLGFMQNDHKIFPWIGGFLFALTSSALSSKIASKIQASKNTVFIAFFLILLAMSYLVVSIFPLLEMNHSQAFFGDLVYLGGVEMYLAIFISLLALVLLVINQKGWCNHSFLLSTFGQDSLVGFKQDFVFSTMSLLLIVTSVFTIGTLMTLSALFISTIILSFARQSSLSLHFWACGVVTCLSVIIGFIASIQIGDLPTVPFVVLILVSLSVLVYFLFNILFHRNVGLG